jgi:hypothetical protein
MKGYAMNYLNFFGRINESGDVVVFHDSGETATRLDANVYPIGSTVTARYEHPSGIVLTRPDADLLGIVVYPA